MLQIGDTVQLNSGGLEMTVIACDGQNARVKYEAEDEFPSACLRKVVKNPDSARCVKPAIPQPEVAPCNTA